MSDFWGEAKQILGTVAPALATAVGGPFAGMAARAITGALLGKESGDLEAAAEAVRNATPEQLLALKRADAEFATRMKELDVELEQVAAADRDSARRRQVETKDKMPGFIAAGVLAGFFGILGCMVFVELPVSAKDPLQIMLGGLAVLVSQLGNYYFGSSAGSASKQLILDRLTGGSQGERAK